jgi:hypothetical protein
MSTRAGKRFTSYSGIRWQQFGFATRGSQRRDELRQQAGARNQLC